jgi:sugar lactone lactonase YvrE
MRPTPLPSSANRCARLIWIAALTVCIGAVLFRAGPVWAEGIYWTDSTLNTLERADLDGGNRQVILSGLNYPEGIFIDSDNDRMYWVEGGGGGSIRSAHLDGSDLQTILTGVGVPAGLDVDLGTGELYWTDVAQGKVWRAGIDGTGLEQIASFMSHPRGIAAHTAAQELYVSGATLDRVQRMNYDGTGIEDVMADLSSSVDVALDLALQQVYVATSDGVYRAGFDGSNQEMVYPLSDSGLEIDPTSRLIYGSTFDGIIWRASLDGGEVDTLIADGVVRARHLTLSLSEPASVPPASTPEGSVLVGAYPNPFTSEVNLSFRLTGSSGATLTIHDASGGTIRTLRAPVGFRPGSGTDRYFARDERPRPITFTWDGRDNRGRSVARGVYPFALRTNEGVTTGTAVRLR